MESKFFLLVCRSRATGNVYLSRSVFNLDEVSHYKEFLDTIGVDVVDVLSIGVDFSQYAH